MKFREAERVQRSLLSSFEKKVLIWLAQRTPAWVTPDHLTILGLVSMLVAGGAYAAAGSMPAALHLVNVCLALNWLGDSLDGTLARVRQRLRPRYGFYVDHMVDAFSALFLLGGLALSGLMTERVALLLLLAFLLLAVNSYLATYTLGTFRISYSIFSPTEARILLAVGNLWAVGHPVVRLFGREYLFFDLAGQVAIPCMFAVLLVSIIQNTRALYRAEPL
jgi:phosphatidylglycerophosphate synthase